MDAIDTNGLPSVLVTLLAPWLAAIDASEPGMGDHLTAIAAHASMSLLHRIELTPALELALVDARAATDTLALALDRKRTVPRWVCKAVRGAMSNLITTLRRAEPNAVTKELGLGW